MPYRKGRRSYRKRNYRKRSTYVRKVARSEAKKACSKQLETKMFDGAVNTTAIDWSGSTSIFNMTYDPIAAANILQGVADNQYVGSRIKPTYLTIRGSISQADGTNVVRVILVQDKVSGSVLSGATILESVGNIRAPYSPLERDYEDTFRVILDRMFKFDSDENIKTFKFKVSGKLMRRITFRGAAGAVESGGLYLLFVSDSGASSHPTTVFTWRLSYKDA